MVNTTLRRGLWVFRLDLRHFADFSTRFTDFYDAPAENNVLNLYCEIRLLPLPTEST